MNANNSKKNQLLLFCSRILTLDTLFFILLMIINVTISMYVARDTEYSNSELEKSLKNANVNTFGVLGTYCIVIVTIRSILESIDSDEMNKFFKDTSVSLDDSIIFNIVLSIAISAPLLALSLPTSSKVVIYVILDSSMTFNITCGLSIICCIKAADQSKVSKYFYHMLCTFLLVSQQFFISSIENNDSFKISTANNLYIGSMALHFSIEYLYNLKKTIANFKNGQMFVFNSLENIKFAYTFFHLFKIFFYGILKIYFEYHDNTKRFHYLNYTPFIIIAFQSPTFIINFAVLIIPKRLDADIRVKMEELIFSSINQKEESAILSKKLLKMVNNNTKLLEEIFPSRIVQRLLNQEKIEPEKFECATIFFSDIVGFTQLCLEKTPIEVFILLNKLYTLMDSVADIFSAYKIETIGDAYVIGCGLGESENEHHISNASNIADFALVVREVVSLVEVQLPSSDYSTGVKLRIGINSGPIIGGIVGTKMPRYCLFGSTMNISSRMESTSLPQQIQISEMTADLLKACGHYILEERGEIEVKNAGRMKTFWLVAASEKHPIINAEYIRKVKDKAEKELLRKFSALQQKKIQKLCGQSYLSSYSSNETASRLNESSDDSLLKILKQVSMTGSFLITQQQLLKPECSPKTSALNKLAIVGNIKIKDDENKFKQEWDISYLDKLNDCIQEIEYGNSFQGIIIDLDHCNLRNSDWEMFMTRMDKIQYKERIIGITNDYFGIEALKLEIGISILMKPLDTNIVNSILENQVLD